MPDSDDICWKKKKIDSSIVEDGFTFDSREEQWFYWQIKELVERGFITKVERPSPFLLSESVDAHYQDGDKQKYKKKQHLKPHQYTPDFAIDWHPDILLNPDGKKLVKQLFQGQFAAPFIIDSNNRSLIEVKPQFDRSGSTTKSLINIKWLFSARNIFVQLVKISVQSGSWFDMTWTPSRFLLTDKTAKERKLKYQSHSLNDFLVN